MKKAIHALLLLPLILLLAACGGGKDKTLAVSAAMPEDGPLTPMPGEFARVIDPGNGVFMDAITSYIAARGAPANSQYEFTRIDLNGDGRREGLVLLHSPHHYWCGLNGCQMVVFAADDEGFTPMAAVAPVRGPLMVSDKETNGWRDIIVRVSGRQHIETKDVALRFDGRTYPQSPAQQPAIYASSIARGTEIFP